MKKILILLLGILPFVANAQIDTLPWCPPGATWVYTDFIHTSKQIKYVKDTIVNGKQSKKLSLSKGIANDYNSFEFEFNFYMAYENDTLFLYRDSTSYYHVYSETVKVRDDRWEILCVFSGNEGDSWQIKEETNYCDSVDTISIERIDTTRILAAPFLTEEYILNAQNFTIPSSFYKGIGPVHWYPLQVEYNHVFGNPSTVVYCEGNHEFRSDVPLACYKDSLRGTIVVKNFENFRFEEGCDIISSINEIYYKDVALYPNPNTSQLQLKNIPEGSYTLAVFDSFGKKIIQDIEWDNKPIRIDDLSNGVYYLHVKAASGEEQFFKFLKE